MTPYLNLLKDVLVNGKISTDRTGTGTKRVFGRQIRFNLRDGFPLCTTKEVNIDAVYSELLWFISGSSNLKALRALRHGQEHYDNESKKTIWDGNYYKQAVVDLGYQNGYLGPVYGYQWRFAQGIDQLKQCEDQIRDTPDSRRIILDAWNPVDIPNMALPPCHMMQQWFVDEGELSLQVYMRSVDICTGLPYNIASYAMLLSMMAKVTSTKPRELIFALGDAHLYLNHIESATEQVDREPFDLPDIEIIGDQKTLGDFVMGDIKIHNYIHHDKLFYPMNV